MAPEHWATVGAAVLIGPIITFTLHWAPALSVWTTGTTHCSWKRTGPTGLRKVYRQHNGSGKTGLHNKLLWLAFSPVYVGTTGVVLRCVAGTQWGKWMLLQKGRSWGHLRPPASWLMFLISGSLRLVFSACCDSWNHFPCLGMNSHPSIP